MDVVAYLPADPQAAEPVQVGERAFHDPALGAESGAVFGAPAGDDRLHAEIPDQAAVLVVVVVAVAQHHVRAAPGRPRLPRTGGNRLKQWDQLGDVVAVAAGQGSGERDAGGVGDQVMFAARPTPIDGASSGLGSPFNARIWEPSTAAREKSRAFALRSSARRTSWSRGHAPASVHSARRRQQVLPEPKPSSCGRCSQAIPVQDEQDALEHQPVRMPLASRMPDPTLHLGQQRLDQRPQLVINVPWLRPRADDGEVSGGDVGCGPAGPARG